MKLTNEKVFEIVYLLKQSYPDLTKYDKRFNFAVSRNLANLSPIASELVKARETGIPKFIEFEQKKSDIIRNHQMKDEKDNLIFKSDEERDITQSEVNALAEEYKDAIDERQKEIDIYNEIISEPVDVEIVKCSFNAVPDDFNFAVLRDMIKESDEEIAELL